MSKKLIHILITRMHVKLNKLIEEKNFDLQNYDVQNYSRRLDRALVRYNRLVKGDRDIGRVRKIAEFNNAMIF